MAKIFFIILASLLPLSVSAAATVKLDNPITGINSLLGGDVYIGGVIKRILAVIGSLALLMLVYGGLSIILAAGNETKIKQGKSVVAYTAIGLVVIFMSYTAITFFLKTLGGNLHDEYEDLPIVPETSFSSENSEEGGFIGPLETGQCPAGCMLDKSCFDLNQPVECWDTPGCCLLINNNEEESISPPETEQCPAGCVLDEPCFTQPTECFDANCCI